MVSSRISLRASHSAERTQREHHWQALSLGVPIKIVTAEGCAEREGNMTSAIKVKPGFDLAKLDLDRRLADETSYQQKLHKLQIAMLELEQIYRVERRRGIIALEGWDASGKGGAIQRLTEKLDPRSVH